MDDFTAVAPINGYGSYLPDEIIARTDLSAEAKILCHELDKYRNGDPRSERYLQCNPGHFTLQEKCGFRSKRQVEQIVRELVDKDLVEVQPGQKAKYVLSWPTPAEQEQRQRAELEAKREEIRAEVERHDLKNIKPCTRSKPLLLAMKRQKIGSSMANICKIISRVWGKQNIKGPSSFGKNRNSTRTRRN